MRLLYDRDDARLFVGDARRMDALADGSVHLVVTSPPYWSARPEYASWPTYQGYLADMALAWAECYRVLCDGGRIAVNVPMGYGREATGGYVLIGDDTTRGLLAAGFTMRGHIIWDKCGVSSRCSWGSWKSATGPVLRDMHEIIIVAHKGAAVREPGESTIDSDTFMAATASIWRISPATSARAWHPAPFPIEIPRRLIQLYSFAGDTVLDPFAGSGTTVWEAAKAGRLGIGIDLSEEYVRRAAGPMFCEVAP